MNLTTQYLGLQLKNPLVVGASPFCDNTQAARQLQDAGAAAIVMRSLFEEQINIERRVFSHRVDLPVDIGAEAKTYFPAYTEYELTPDHYCVDT